MGFSSHGGSEGPVYFELNPPRGPCGRIDGGFSADEREATPSLIRSRVQRSVPEIFPQWGRGRGWGGKEGVGGGRDVNFCVLFWHFVHKINECCPEPGCVG